jgi:hypothetical protein
MIGHLADWIEDGEKYALVASGAEFEGTLPPGQIAANRWALVDTRLSIPAHWREWLGSTEVQVFDARPASRRTGLYSLRLRICCGVAPRAAVKGGVSAI